MALTTTTTLYYYTTLLRSVGLSIFSTPLLTRLLLRRSIQVVWHSLLSLPSLPATSRLETLTIMSSTLELDCDCDMMMECGSTYGSDGYDNHVVASSDDDDGVNVIIDKVSTINRTAVTAPRLQYFSVMLCES